MKTGEKIEEGVYPLEGRAGLSNLPALNERIDKHNHKKIKILC